jgi:hypothetical protein
MLSCINDLANHDIESALFEPLWNFVKTVKLWHGTRHHIYAYKSDLNRRFHQDAVEQECLKKE